MTDDPRHAQRIRTLKAAKIVVGNGTSVFDCIVRNMSETGALLQIEGVFAIPDEINVVIGTGSEAKTRRAKVVRREVFGIGVKFEK
jgi:hypothetical protein